MAAQDAGNGNKIVYLRDYFWRKPVRQPGFPAMPGAIQPHEYMHSRAKYFRSTRCRCVPRLANKKKAREANASWAEFTQ